MKQDKIQVQQLRVSESLFFKATVTIKTSVENTIQPSIITIKGLTDDLKMASNTYLLNGPNDWDAFEQAYIMKTTAERVSRLARLSDPNQFNELRIAEPIKPEYSNYKARTQQGGTANVPRFVRGEEAANHFSELVPEDQEDIKTEITLYRSEYNRYIKQAEGIRNVLNWLLEKTTPHYIETCSPAMMDSEDDDNISQFFANLKAACGVNDELRRKQARKAYFEVLKQGTNDKTNWQEWITKWEKMMRTAKLKGVAEVQHPTTWFEDLEQALDHQFKILLRIERSQNREAIINGTYLPSTFAVQLREEVQNSEENLSKQAKGRIAKGSFGPTFQGSNSQGQKRIESPNQGSGQGKEKRIRQSSEAPERCILCERTHKGANTTSCWHAFPELMPKKYTRTDKQTEAWENRLENNQEVRNLYEQLKTSKGSSPEQTQ